MFDHRQTSEALRELVYSDSAVFITVIYYRYYQGKIILLHFNLYRNILEIRVYGFTSSYDLYIISRALLIVIRTLKYFKNLIESQRHWQHSPLLVHSPHTPDGKDWARLKLKGRNSIEVYHVGDRNPSLLLPIFCIGGKLELGARAIYPTLVLQYRI